jgi:hypothetical protein
VASADTRKCLLVRERSRTAKRSGGGRTGSGAGQRSDAAEASRTRTARPMEKFSPEMIACKQTCVPCDTLPRGPPIVEPPPLWIRCWPRELGA